MQRLLTLEAEALARVPEACSTLNRRTTSEVVQLPGLCPICCFRRQEIILCRLAEWMTNLSVQNEGRSIAPCQNWWAVLVAIPRIILRFYHCSWHNPTVSVTRMFAK